MMRILAFVVATQVMAQLPSGIYRIRELRVARPVAGVKIFLAKDVRTFPQHDEILLHRNGEWRIVRSPAEASKYFRVESGADALAFVRLFTSPVIYRDMKWPFATDVLLRSKLTSDTFLGEQEMLKWAKKGREGREGVVDGKLYAALDAAPRVKEVPGGFVVSRLLLRPTEPHYGCYLVRLSEYVGRNGEYKVLSESKVNNPAATVLRLALPPE